MKKLVIICAAMAVAALSLTACHKEESSTDNQKFIASFEQVGNGKFSIDGDLQMYWDDIWFHTLFGVYVPESTVSNPEHFSVFKATSISEDGKTAVFEYYNTAIYAPFPAGQQGPFYAASDYVQWNVSHINDDGSFHVGIANNVGYMTPMVARSDDFGELHFKHLFGILKIYLNLPEGYEPRYIRTQKRYMKNCDVTWDANGEITLSNFEVVKPYDDYEIYWRGNNGFFYSSVCPGDMTGITFSLETKDANNVTKIFRKTMNPNASIHIERAGITTLTINFTENDIQN
ncbi:MAG: hypothetical protein MJZ67_03210 [Bacteroidales bacterium]|nr:hypothetical protein [Bacteroidales bacterium]